MESPAAMPPQKQKAVAARELLVRCRRDALKNLIGGEHVAHRFTRRWCARRGAVECAAHAHVLQIFFRVCKRDIRRTKRVSKLIVRRVFHDPVAHRDHRIFELTAVHLPHALFGVSVILDIKEVVRNFVFAQPLANPSCEGTALRAVDGGDHLDGGLGHRALA